MPFFQEPPELGNAFVEDRALGSWLRRTLPGDVMNDVAPSLEEMGELARGSLHALAREHRLDEPRHVPYDAWGHRVDRVEVNAAWREYARVAAEKGLVATAYERRHGAFSRVHQLSLVYLFAPSSQTYTCPLAMTDGCARTLEGLPSSAFRDEAFERLTSRDPARAWTSGQWMTERTGGSDVGLSETVARRDESGAFRLYGTKWFTSAVSSEVALTLARPEGNGPGGKGLALFFVRVRDDGGRLNGIVVHRLKDKLGTRHLPTAELTLDGTVATPLAGLSDGVRHMAPMLNVTRTWNAVCSVAGMQRGLSLARDYARRRVAFGSLLADKPLHLETLADLAAEHEGALALALHEALLLGKSETGTATPREEAALSVIQPVVKLFAGKTAVTSASEVLECFGGAGYVEDTGLPALLRDAQVLSIWEGTTNVLSLESLRALAREEAAGPLLEMAEERARNTAHPELQALAKSAAERLRRAVDWARATSGESRPALESGARRFALALARALALSLLAEHAAWCLEHDADARPMEAARRFAERSVEGLFTATDDFARVRALALGEALPSPRRR
ncbi:MAG TPA: acyl-CoA dehydrogenase family protein [Polyangiaceae bacterium]|jgi:alkylation response protein AidB-like acyl-CoA dehydrogenase|nr:acyl-CoA dehydrogenase family protein [Polyangiaceae bacterium]